MFHDPFRERLYTGFGNDPVSGSTQLVTVYPVEDLSDEFKIIFYSQPVRHSLKTTMNTNSLFPKTLKNWKH